MATKRKTVGRKRAATTSTGRAKAKVKRVARKAKKSLNETTHDAGLTLRRTARKLKGTAQKLGTKLEQAKAPAKRRARRVERTVVSVLESAGESISAAVRKAKRRFGAA